MADAVRALEGVDVSAALQLAASRTVVISQPMLFPWVGLLEQVRQADVWVHYDDVQFSKGSFTNRVQLKVPGGTDWMTIPLANRRLGARIDELLVDERKPWRRAHLDKLAQLYAGAPHLDDALSLVRRVYSLKTDRLVDVVIASFHALVDYFDLAQGRRFVMSADVGVGGSGSTRVLELVRRFDGGRYVTGHGASNYLEHELFERSGVRVEYLDYQLRPYPQLHGTFTPFVSGLDLVANVGRAGRSLIASGTVSWREFHERRR